MLAYGNGRASGMIYLLVLPIMTDVVFDALARVELLIPSWTTVKISDCMYFSILVLRLKRLTTIPKWIALFAGKGHQKSQCHRSYR